MVGMLLYDSRIDKYSSTISKVPSPTAGNDGSSS